ncbi:MULTISPECIES: efflux RND transporter periplasmic adaptor subunit [unclassified Burkholderia]|uniref:efflux RND transporter periplasmic adaptor subunit n=1 Tax=unclassified Burkholderia TaxID=2613784 RepID=UPI000F5665C4|nr:MULTISPECIES: efflux RND transporter periplasmic adaptor subunit [unclassified Burkholderia]RQR87491.1 efflux RND transporter periplasmic adaptor subunit [Burkholderia sp. Bp9011]RQR96842.1 efflux RND transporter periplasmic adaptor subunit [Burkholderia sp. Bp9010]RQS07484.1 efflux RND transporter periplasmic adaptor subunit [Burkholderia sp. Bp8991]RQS30745.1 efflux RND transporter periplasmic adaptor subunit [Burkholderia sp. Bp8995]RQS51538.1 efflux RND transporter periplasmic adaptor s
MFRRHRLVYTLGLASLALAACGEHPAADPRTEAPLVRTSAVHGAAGASRSFSGVVGARVQSDLGFRVQGKVIERLVDAGQTVKRGQPLMRIDPIDLGLQARAQQKLVDAAQARATQTAADEARYRDLVGAGAVSASTYDQLKAAADSARAQLVAAQAQAVLANNASGYAVVMADADGVVVETLAEPGQVVAPGQIVVRLAHAGPREAVVQLPETLRPASGSIAAATLYGADQKPVPAVLRQLSDSADRLTRTYEARYVLEGALSNAPLGATVTIDLAGDAGQTQAGMVVPVGALFDPGTGTGVWTVDRSQSRVTWHKVRVTALSDDSATVTGDLREGDQVVALGAQLLHDGERVRLANDKLAAASVSTQGAAQ